MNLANDGNFREMRYFTAWDKRRDWVNFDLPPLIKEAAKQDSPVPFGDVVTQSSDTVIGVECCEELFVSRVLDR